MEKACKYLMIVTLDRQLPEGIYAVPYSIFEHQSRSNLKTNGLFSFEIQSLFSYLYFSNNEARNNLRTIFSASVVVIGLILLCKHV